MSDENQDYLYFQLTSYQDNRPIVYYRVQKNLGNPQVWDSVNKTWKQGAHLSFYDKYWKGDPALDFLDSDPTVDL